MSNKTENRQPHKWARPELTRLGTMRDVAGSKGGTSTNGANLNRS